MSIQINDINVIDDDRNFSAAGIVTVGTGNSATTINGVTGITSVGIGITLNGVAGNISIAGTISASGFNIPANIISFSPTNGATDVSLQPSITITFDQAVGIATTGYIFFKQGTINGPTVQTLGVSAIRSIPNGIIVTTNALLPLSTSIYPVIPSGVIKSTSGDFIGLNTTGAVSYNFITRNPQVGDAYEGGYLICQSGGTRWIVAPNSAEISTNWYNRGGANSVAQSVTGCTGWFVPDLGQLTNPGAICKIYWDSYSNFFCYWSNSEYLQNRGWAVNLNTNTGFTQYKPCTLCARSFRCIVY